MQLIKDYTEHEVTETFSNPGEWFPRCVKCGGPVRFSDSAARVLTGHFDPSLDEPLRAVFLHDFKSNYYWEDTSP